MDYTTIIVETYLAAARSQDSILLALTRLLALHERPDIKPEHKKLLYDVTFKLETALAQHV